LRARPTEKPCGKCISCEEITKGNALDVLEIDGASNRGIDEIRNLRETVKFNPASGNFKIYIIDEVHMLTTEAFNALLKTLEEPPAHVKFIFATTESHKVPLTILSRCQRYNFKRISTADITSKLADIAKHEKLKFSNKALFLIAKTADGALRDAESLLDQLASFSEEEIKEEDVLFMLGLASEEVYFQVLEATRNKDASEVFNIVRNLYDGGRDLVQFAKGLLEIFRHLLLLQCSENANQFIEMSDEGIEGLKERKNLFSRGELLLALSIVGIYKSNCAETLLHRVC
jgi:DNA polymerase-3 subunit gamma/tau